MKVSKNPAAPVGSVPLRKGGVSITLVLYFLFILTTDSFAKSWIAFRMELVTLRSCSGLSFCLSTTFFSTASGVASHL